MRVHQIYQQLSPELFRQVFDWFREHDRNVYRSAMASLAQARRLRLVFVQKKPLAEQYAWLSKVLQSPASEAVGEHLLQAWLMAAHAELLVDFCDAVGIVHDGKGVVTGDLPEELEEKPVQDAVSSLLEKHDPEIIALYLRTFNLQRPRGWSAVTAVLQGDERLNPKPTA